MIESFVLVWKREYENTMLVAITEKRSKEQIDLFAKSLASAVAASKTGVGAEA